MIFIEHRKNKISELKNVDLNNGVEIDLRSDVTRPGWIHLSHDAWIVGDSFDLWLKEFNLRKIQGCIYLNTKEDGLEEKAREILKFYNVTNYLFLDTAIPTLVKNVKLEMGKEFFLRLSQYERLENLLYFKDQVEWVWIDCFDIKPLNLDLIHQAKKSFRLCLVSPELQGGSESDFLQFKSLAMQMDAICTKKPQVWRDLLS